jgi:predicted  nucleic acid-binding Zn-ribbon protein
MDKNTTDILDALDFIKERMATKADIAELRLELHTFRTDTDGNFRSLNIELADINRRLDLLEQQFRNLKGVTKEIDDIRDRIRDIEKHLGLNRKIAA